MKVLMPLLFVIFATTACAKEPQKPDATGFAWVDFKQAMNKAQASNKLILVDVYTDW